MTKSKYHQLADAFRQQIKAGKLRVGERLPSQQVICQDFSVSQATVERAYTLLEEDGIIERRWREGVFVKDRPAKMATGNIGIIGSPGFQDGSGHYFAALMEGITRAASAASYHALILGNDLNWDSSGCRKVDGIIIVNIENMQPLLAKIPATLPCVSLLNNTAKLSCVKTDDEGAGRLATEHLLQHGHQRIAFMRNNKWSIPTERVHGYKAALQNARIIPKRSWVYTNNLIGHISPGEQRLAGYNGALSWIENGWRKTGCTALIAQNDHMALGAIRAFMEQGFRVPEDVSVMGFDGTDLCDYFPPRLTSIKIPYADISATAVKVLLEQLHNQERGITLDAFPITIHDGESVCQALDSTTKPCLPQVV